MRKLSETCALTRAFVCAQVKRAPLYDKYGKPIFQLTFELANKRRGLFLARNYIRTTEEFARISKAEAGKAKLLEEIKMLETEISEMDAGQAEATKVRSMNSNAIVILC